MIPRLSLGLEYNPRSDDKSVLANTVAISETDRRPALMFGTSSDRIGTPEGQSYFAPLSKDLQATTGLPLAPYVGAAYGTYENDLRAVGGLRTRFGRGFSSTIIHDGKELHPTVGYRFRERHVVTLMWVATEDVGASYSVAF